MIFKKIFNSFFYNEKYCYFCKENISQKNYICKDCTDKLKIYQNQNLNDYDENSYKKDILFYYSGTIKEKIREFKFKDGLYLQKPFGRLIFEFLDKNLLEEIDFISYVPSTSKKLRKRGYNQSKLLAKEVCKYSSKKLFEGIYKTKDTQDQHFLSLEKRSINLKNSFLVKEDLKGKKILLIDDIHTSGATVDECYKALIAQNCEFVWIVCLCGVI